MLKTEFIDKATYYAKHHIPFLFIIDYTTQKPLLFKLEDAEKHKVFYDIKGLTNYKANKVEKDISLKTSVIEKQKYSKIFNSVKQELYNGNSYLLNLTFKSEIKTSLTLQEIFNVSKAPYKLLYKDKFVVFSPECFIEVFDNIIYTYPMKGTISCKEENAEQKLLADEKEIWEHNTIVDLMRNDLSIIAKDVKLDKYRFISKITTNFGDILQTSSKISGQLDKDWKEQFGEMLFKILPAGSISGAPKKKTLEIIKNNEIADRSYYTGIFGIFDGKNLQSAVSIRYIEQSEEGKTYYHSGGGITFSSELDKEYDELCKKIYIPIV